ncbi:MAG: hypothetical protein ABH806_02415 [Candidatus Omnitrophota bacterium]
MMKRAKVFLSVIFSAVILLNGCASISTLDRTRAEFPDRVKTAVFDASYGEVFAAAKKACQDLKLSVYLEDEAEGKIYARSSLRWFLILISWGTMGFAEKTGIYLTKTDANSTRVEVAIQKAFSGDIGYADWRDRILASIAANLK